MNDRVRMWLESTEDLNAYHETRSEPGDHNSGVIQFNFNTSRWVMQEQGKVSRNKQHTARPEKIPCIQGEGARPKQHIPDKRWHVNPYSHPYPDNPRPDDGGESIESHLSIGSDRGMGTNVVHYQGSVNREHLKSGFLDKPRSQVMVKLMWPHINQNPRYVTASLSFNQLNFAQFVGGECRTILKTDSEEEMFGRLRVLSKVAYRFDQCKDWDRARGAYFAIPSSIKEGEAFWSSSFGHYDVMCPPKHEEHRGEARTVRNRTGQLKKEFFCKDYQKCECNLQPPHKAWIRNTYEMVDHFCAACFKAKLGKVQHPAQLDECPSAKKWQHIQNNLDSKSDTQNTDLWVQYSLLNFEHETESDIDTPAVCEFQNFSPVVITGEMQQQLAIIETVMKPGQYNYQGCKIPVNMKWNVELLDSLLLNYIDKDITQFLRYRFPIEHSDDAQLEMGGKNHMGAVQYPEHVNKYIQKEVEMGGTIGPFESIPFSGKVGISPLSTRAKKDSESRSIIMDCSWPIGFAVNDGMDKDWYLGEPVNLKYPTVDTVVRYTFQLGSKNPTNRVFYWKEDMDRAFRQLNAYPKLVPLLGYHWQGQYFFDLVLVMGCKISPYLMQRTTNIISYILRSLSYFIQNYVDDFIGAEYEDRVQQAHKTFLRLLKNIGASRAETKSVPPTQIIEFLGNLFNATDLTPGITQNRKVEIMRELTKWKHRQVTNRKQMESLVGKLQFISGCVRPGRLFVSRLLNEMKGMKNGQWYRLTDQARKDIQWWYEFIPDFQGSSIMWLLDVFEVDSELAVDACLKVGWQEMANTSQSISQGILRDWKLPTWTREQ